MYISTKFAQQCNVVSDMMVTPNVVRKNGETEYEGIGQNEKKEKKEMKTKREKC